MSETARDPRAAASPARPQAAYSSAERQPARAGTRHDTVLRRFYARAEAEPERVALRDLAAGGAPADVALTWRAWAADARHVAAALVSAGVAPGDRVAVLAGVSPAWPVLDLGALSAGAIVAGVFPTSTAAQVAAVLADAEPRVLVVEAGEQLAKVLAAPAALVPRTIVCVGDPPAAHTAAPDGARPIAWDAFLADGARALADGRVAAEVARRIADASPDDVAALIYTSGSTGEPKGACCTHAYLLASAESVRGALGLTAADTALALLPFAHAAERVFGLHTRIVCGMEGALVRDASRLWDAARAYEPTLFGGLPRFYEKLADALDAAARGAVGPDAAAWARLRATGAERSRLRRDGAPVPPALEREWQTLRAPAAGVIARHLGRRLRLATSGGAPLARELAERLDALGLTVLGAYGQTEHLCVAFNRPDDYAFDVVGRPMPGTELRIADDGEVQVRRGALTFAGYWRRPEATCEAFTADGAWLRTGDLGALDARGRLRITGRRKEILALSTGKKVAPLPIEARLAAHPWVSHAVLCGEGRRFVVALLFVAPAAAGEPTLHDALARAVAEVNATLAPHEQVQRFAVIPRELTEAAGELTPTLKVRRSAVLAAHDDQLEALYA